MFTKEEIEEIIRKKIEADEKTGEQAGGSGHLGFVSYELKEFSSIELPSNLLEIKYRYSLYVETEFTYYPDNPPYESTYQKIIVVNSDKEIVEEKTDNKILENKGEYYTEKDWDAAQKDIMEFIEEFLAKIEWKYGENRAPIKYPPEFYELLSEESGVEYHCTIELDFGDDEKIYFNSPNPYELLNMIKEDFSKRFPQHL